MTLVAAGETNFLFPAGSIAVFAVFLILALVTTALWLLSLVDALRIEDARWARAGQSKLLWVLLIVLLGLLGSLLYLAMARPALRRAPA